MNLREQLNQISIKYQKGGIVKIVDQKGNLIKINRDSDQYSNLYNNKLIQGYDPKTDTYYLYPSHESVVYKSTDTQSSNEIPEIVLKGKKADWVKYKEDYMKNNPKEKYIQEYLDAYPWAHQSLTNYPKRLDEDYENMVNDYIGEQIVKNKPQGNKSREDWLNLMTEQEQRFVQRNPKYGTTLWQDTVEGGKALFNLSNDLQISRIKNSDNYTNLEKKDLIKEHKESPILSNIGDVTQVLSPLTIPSKIVQSVYRPEYSLKDAVHGTKNKAGMLEDIATDPLNLVGAEFFNKFDNLNKIIKPLNNFENISTETLNPFLKILNKSNDIKIKNSSHFIESLDDFKNDIDFLKNREIAYIDSPEYMNLRMKNTGETESQVLKSIKTIKKNMDRTTFNMSDRLNTGEGEYLNSFSTFTSPKSGKFLPSFDYNPSINISKKNSLIEDFLGSIDHEIKHGYSPVGTDLGIYRNYPTLKVNIPNNKNLESYLSKPYEQQVRFNKFKDLLEENIGLKRGNPITEQHLKDFSNTSYNSRYYDDVNLLFDNIDKNTSKKDFLDVLNKAWGVIPTIGGSATIGYELSNDKDSNNSQPSYQIGGEVNNINQAQSGGLIYYPNIEKGISPSDKNAFLTALNFENKYITSPKFKERVEKAGYNFQDYMSNMKGILKNISLTVDDSKINASGAYYRPDTNEVGISTKLIPNMLKKSDVFSHEIGHSFSNENLKKFIDDRNILVPTDPIERKKMEEKLKDQNYYNGDGHEQEDREMVADVHSARYELYKYGIDNKSKNIYDGRYSNFTNSAYNDMLKIAEDNPFSASARLLNKVGSRKFDKEWDKATSDVKTINSDAEQERYDETLNKIDEKAKKLNKQYIFEIMNRVVQNNNLNDIEYAQEGGSLNNIRNILNNIYNKYE